MALKERGRVDESGTIARWHEGRERERDVCARRASENCGQLARGAAQELRVPRRALYLSSLKHNKKLRRRGASESSHPTGIAGK